jgi:hypothetical protein
MMKSRLWIGIVVLLLAALTGCGGGGDGGASNAAPPQAQLSFDRIEPLDTAVVTTAAAVPAPAKSQALAADPLPPTASVAHVDLGPLVATKQTAARNSGAPAQIGVARAVLVTASAADLARQLHWVTLADGSRVAAIQFTASGARALRLGLQVDQLPAGAWLRFRGATDTDAVVVTAAAIDAIQQLDAASGVQGAAARMYWGPDIEGPATTLELHLPAGSTSDQVRLAIPQVSHLTRSARLSLAAQGDTSEIGSAGACDLDVMCSPEADAESRAVVRLEFTNNGATFLCTGTLLNDKPASRTPYVLTASHCISDRATASTLMTYWFFRAASCGSSPQMDPRAVSQHSGADLLSVTANTDTTLLRLRQAPPAGVVYAGSYFGSGVDVGASVFDVQNPAGDLQKISFGGIVGDFICPQGDGPCDASTAANATSYEVRWNGGVTEPGSSGSALFAAPPGSNTDYVVGALHGGASSCRNPQGSDFFGRFDRSFAAGIRSWLVPQ